MSDNFNFDLDRMKLAVESATRQLPAGISFDEYIEWTRHQYLDDYDISEVEEIHQQFAKKYGW